MTPEQRHRRRARIARRARMLEDPAGIAPVPAPQREPDLDPDLRRIASSAQWHTGREPFWRGRW